MILLSLAVLYMKNKQTNDELRGDNLYSEKIITHRTAEMVGLFSLIRGFRYQVTVPGTYLGNLNRTRTNLGSTDKTSHN